MSSTKTRLVARIRKNYSFLVKELKVSLYVNELFQEEVISIEEKEELAETHSRKEKAQIFVDSLMLKPAKSIQKFFEIVKTQPDKQPHIYGELFPDLVSNEQKQGAQQHDSYEFVTRGTRKAAVSSNAIGDPQWEEIMIPCLPAVVDALRPDLLVDRLLEGRLLTRTEYDQLLQGSMTQEELSRQLVQLLPCRKGSFATFCKVLLAVRGQQHIVTEILKLPVSLVDIHPVDDTQTADSLSNKMSMSTILSSPKEQSTASAKIEQGSSRYSQEEQRCATFFFKLEHLEWMKRMKTAICSICAECFGIDRENVLLAAAATAEIKSMVERWKPKKDADHPICVDSNRILAVLLVEVINTDDILDTHRRHLQLFIVKHLSDYDPSLDESGCKVVVIPYDLPFIVLQLNTVSAKDEAQEYTEIESMEAIEPRDRENDSPKLGTDSLHGNNVGSDSERIEAEKQLLANQHEPQHESSRLRRRHIASSSNGEKKEVDVRHSSDEIVIGHEMQVFEGPEKSSTPVLSDPSDTPRDGAKHNTILIWNDDRDEKSSRFVQEQILQRSDTPNVTFVDRSFHVSKQETPRPPVGEGLIKRAVDAVYMGTRNRTDQQGLGATYTGVAVVLPADTSYERQEDIELLDNISSEFENGSLTVMCIKMKETSVTPTQLRCSQTVDYFRVHKEQLCWQIAIRETLMDNTSLLDYQEPGTGRPTTESDSESTGGDDNDSDPSSLKTRGKRSRASKQSPPTYFTFDCRNLTFHRAMERVVSKFPFPQVFYAIFSIQLIAGLFYWASTSTLPSNGLEPVKTVVFLTLIYIPLRFLLPFAAVEHLNWLRKPYNSSLPVKVPQAANSSMYSALKDFYSPRDLEFFTVNNAARRSEMNLDRGLQTIVLGSIFHSFMVTVQLWLLGVLDVTLPLWIPNQASFVVTAFNFLASFSSLMILGIVLAQHSFEARISGYRFDFARKGTLIMEEYFKRPYDELRRTWGSLIIASSCFVLAMFLYVLLQENDSSLFQVPNEDCRTLWIVIAVVFLVADIITFCSDSRVMTWGSVPVSCCCLVVLVASLFLAHKESHNNCISSQSLGHARHLLLFLLLLVRLTVMFVRSLSDACRHWNSPVPWAQKDKLIVVLSVIGLGLVFVICCWLGSVVYSVA